MPRRLKSQEAKMKQHNYYRVTVWHNINTAVLILKQSNNPMQTPCQWWATAKVDEAMINKTAEQTERQWFPFERTDSVYYVSKGGNRWGVRDMAWKQKNVLVHLLTSSRFLCSSLICCLDFFGGRRGGCNGWGWPAPVLLVLDFDTSAFVSAWDDRRSFSTRVQ